MRNPIAIIILLVVCLSVNSQSKFSLEQYSYLGSTTTATNTVSPIAHYQSKSNWYAEARYNYEEAQTFSLYAGRTFAKENRFSYSFTPMVGGMTGKLKGAALGLNMELDFENFNFSSQSQYAMMTGNVSTNFFFSWSELSYRPVSWFYGGLSMQHTQMYRTNALVEPGVMVGFSIKQWTIPLYGFIPYADNRYFIVGVGYEWKHDGNNKRKTPPSYLTQKD